MAWGKLNQLAFKFNCVQVVPNENVLHPDVQALNFLYKFLIKYSKLH